VGQSQIIVLTGGAGFIGSCFLAKFNEMDEKEVLVVDHNDSEVKMANLKGKFFEVFFITYSCSFKLCSTII